MLPRKTARGEEALARLSVSDIDYCLPLLVVSQVHKYQSRKTLAEKSLFPCLV